MIEGEVGLEANPDLEPPRFKTSVYVDLNHVSNLDSFSLFLSPLY